MKEYIPITDHDLLKLSGEYYDNQPFYQRGQGIQTAFAKGYRAGEAAAQCHILKQDEEIERLNHMLGQVEINRDFFQEQYDKALASMGQLKKENRVLELNDSIRKYKRAMAEAILDPSKDSETRIGAVATLEYYIANCESELQSITDKKESNG
jgi:hypothetical protein